MPIFQVEVRTTLVVEAHDEDNAIIVTREHIRDAVRDYDARIESVDEVTQTSQLRDSWDGMCFPYGGDGNTRLKDMLTP